MCQGNFISGAPIQIRKLLSRPCAPYSLPCELVGQLVSTRLYPASVIVAEGEQIVAPHERLRSAGETRYGWQRCIPLLLGKPRAIHPGRNKAN